MRMEKKWVKSKREKHLSAALSVQLFILQKKTLSGAGEGFDLVSDAGEVLGKVSLTV